jgi:aspartyl/glutamyl-tRNA(Asn/Gln) amidotransferase C subunit
MIEDRDIEKLALLSRIEITEEEKPSLRRDIEAVLSYISDIANVAGKAAGGTSQSPLRNIMREDADAHESAVYTESLLSLAPQREGNYVKVKSILRAKP